MQEMINSYQNQLRSCASRVELSDIGIAMLLRDAAAEMDEKDKLISRLLYSDERGRGVQFDEALQELSNLIEFDRRKYEL